MLNKEETGIRLAIAIPTYNEARNIGKLAGKIKEVVVDLPIDCTVFIIDDNSPDGTGKIADELAASEKGKTFHVKVFHRQMKEGLGKAYAAGFKELLRLGTFTHIMQMDADFSHDPKYIKDLVREAQQGKDFVAASRYMKGGGIVGWTLHRRILSLGGNIYTRVLLGNRITDYTNGLNIFTAELLRKIDPNTLDAKGYGFLLQLKYKALHYAKNYGQIPIVLADRLHGKSKIPKNTILVNIFVVLKLRFSKVA